MAHKEFLPQPLRLNCHVFVTETPYPRADEIVEAFARLVNARLGAARVDAIGHSYGGILVLSDS